MGQFSTCSIATLSLKGFRNFSSCSSWIIPGCQGQGHVTWGHGKSALTHGVQDRVPEDSLMWLEQPPGLSS